MKLYSQENVLLGFTFKCDVCTSVVWCTAVIQLLCCRQHAALCTALGTDPPTLGEYNLFCTHFTRLSKKEWPARE